MSVKLFETSPLEFPITLLRKLLPAVERRYPGNSRVLDAYEHVWVGAVTVLFFSLMASLFGNVWLYGILPIFGFHVILKELVRDRIKHGKFNWVDVTTRCFGFVLFAAFPAILLMR